MATPSNRSEDLSEEREDASRSTEFDANDDVEPSLLSVCSEVRNEARRQTRRARRPRCFARRSWLQPGVGTSAVRRLRVPIRSTQEGDSTGAALLRAGVLRLLTLPRLRHVLHGRGPRRSRTHLRSPVGLVVSDYPVAAIVRLLEVLDVRVLSDTKSELLPVSMWNRVAFQRDTGRPDAVLTECRCGATRLVAPWRVGQRCPRCRYGVGITS